MALKVAGSGALAGTAAEAGVEIMAGKTASENGVIRRTGTAQARRIRKGARIPEGWAFESEAPAVAEEAPKAAPKGKKSGPTEDTDASGPSETA